MNTNNFGVDLNRLEAFGEEYSTEINALLERLRKSDLERQCSNLKAFAKKYTLLPCLWQHWNDVENQLQHNGNESVQYQLFRNDRKSSSDKHLYIDYDMDGPFKESPLHALKRIKSYKEGLFYPHQNIEKLFHKYDRYSSFALSRKELQQYEAARALYKKMKDVIGKADEWFECMKEISDQQYIINSCEYRLSEDPYDALFWDSYLHYLKTADTKMWLKTYSRYCRLFLFDYYCRDEYCHAIASSNVSDKAEYWIDYICLFRMFDGLFATNEKMLQILVDYYNIPESFNFTTDDDNQNLKTFLEMVKSKETKCLLPISDMFGSNVQLPIVPTSSKFIARTLTSVIRQANFPFKATLLRYILNHASPAVLQKLQMCCKELFLQKPLIYCHRVCVRNEIPGSSQPVFFENALIVTPSQLQNLNLNNYHLVNYLEIFDVPSFSFPWISKCSLQYVKIFNQKLDENVFDFLTANAKVVEFTEVKVKKDDGTIASVEFLVEKLSHVPHIKLIDLPKESFNEGTARNLAALERSKKLRTFYLNRLPQGFKTDLLCKFIDVNADNNATLKFGYDVLNKVLKFHLGQILRSKLYKLGRDYIIL